MSYNSTHTGAQIDAAIDAVENKQDKLVSGTNIKTINSTSILGSGNITISAASSWNDISGKPSEFPPEDHDHSFNEVLGSATTPETVPETGAGSPKQSKSNYYINASSPGNEISYSGWSIRYFDVQGFNEVFVTWSAESRYNAWYSADGTYISNPGTISAGTITLTVPANAAILDYLIQALL